MPITDLFQNASFSENPNFNFFFATLTINMQHTEAIKANLTSDYSKLKFGFNLY
jgi:hypothetical protein